MNKEKRASEATLSAISPLINDLRNIDALAEKKTGVFYLNGKELLHFHQIESDVVADVFLPNERIRLPVTKRSDQHDLIDRLWASIERSSRQNKTKRRRGSKRL